jgi:type I restriction enzyme R subunit
VLVHSVVESGFSPSLVRSVDSMGDYDLFDVLGSLAYPMQPRTRRQRVEVFKTQNDGWLGYLPSQTAQTLLALAGQFAKSGTEGLESTEVFQTPAVVRAGGLAAIREAGNPAELVKETKARLFAI